MKNFTLNLSFNRMIFENWNNKVLQNILVLFLFISISENCIAQTNNAANIKEVDSFLLTLKSKSTSDFQKLDDLLHKLNPAIYTYDNTLKVYGERCTVLYSDMTSLTYIKNNPIPSNNIELLKINIKKSSDLNGKIDLSIFSEYPNLKYIYIYSEIAINENYINQMFINYDSKYSLVYKINLGE